jgi:sugar phosphate isomerase/epimerase
MSLNAQSPELRKTCGASIVHASPLSRRWFSVLALAAKNGMGCRRRRTRRRARPATSEALTAGDDIGVTWRPLASSSIVRTDRMTRRDFGRQALTGAGTFAALSAFRGSGAQLHALARAAAPRSGNRSLIGGVQFGLQPFCYHDLPMTPANRGTLISRLVQNGFGMVELHATWVEPRVDGPDVSPQEAREKLRGWRLGHPVDHYRSVKQEFDAAGIEIYTYYVNINDSYTDAEVDAMFEAAKMLGARGCVGSQGLALSERLARFPGKHGLFLGLHNHANLSDPDALNNEASFVKGLAFSPDMKATLDTRHFTAANGDCIAFLERHHERMSSVHLGDRRRDNGRSTPFGEGDVPIIEVLRMIRDNKWPIVVLLEFEHGTLRPQVEEVQLMFDYCKRAVLS